MTKEQMIKFMKAYTAWNFNIQKLRVLGIGKIYTESSGKNIPTVVPKLLMLLLKLSQK